LGWPRALNPGGTDAPIIDGQFKTKEQASSP
jgi:hypothetical protein